MASNASSPGKKNNPPDHSPSPNFRSEFHQAIRSSPSRLLSPSSRIPSMQQHFRIIGSARYLPPKRISAEQLDAKLGLPVGTTLSRTGIRFRYEAVAPESAATMAKIVIEDALAAAQCTVREIDFLIDASLCVQQPIPCNAALIQE